MSRPLEGRVAIVTGAGRGLGRAYALHLAEQGSLVVVNDLDQSVDAVVEEILAAGGRAVADYHDVTEPVDAQALIDTAVANFGTLHVVVNNAGVLRDAPFRQMTIQQFDEVIRVHLRGHYCVTWAAVQYWNAEPNPAADRDAVLIETTSIAGLHGSPGQLNYSMAKAGIAEMAVVLDHELNPSPGVRCYAIAPGARTRMTLGVPIAAAVVAAPPAGAFDYWDPANVAPFIGWLSVVDCPAPSGTIYAVEGDRIRRYQPWSVAAEAHNGNQWTNSDLDSVAADLNAGARRSSALDFIAVTRDDNTRGSR